jgi:hypothetical protein
MVDEQALDHAAQKQQPRRGLLQFGVFCERIDQVLIRGLGNRAKCCANGFDAVLKGAPVKASTLCPSAKRMRAIPSIGFT